MIALGPGRAEARTLPIHCDCSIAGRVRAPARPGPNAMEQAASPALELDRCCTAADSPREMRLLCLLIGFTLTTASIARAQAQSLDSLPFAVHQTIDQEKGSGIPKLVDTYRWGETTIYRIEIDIDGVPDTELHIADSGKLIRIDRLREPREESD